MAKTTKVRDRLTPRQHRIATELAEIAFLLKVDYANIKSYERAARTPLLEMMRRKLILSEVITSYTLTDEHLSSIVEAFGGRKMPASALADFMIAHEAHHKGQVWVMARMTGVQPPMFVKA